MTVFVISSASVSLGLMSDAGYGIMFGDVDARIRKCCTGSLLEFYTYRAERYGFMSSEDMETDVRSLKLKALAGTNEVCSYGLQNLK